MDGIFLLGGRAKTCGGPENPGDLPGDVIVPSVRSDEEGGASVLTRHLREQGHTRVALLGGQSDVTSTVENLRVAQEAFPDAPPQWTRSPA